MKAEADAKFVCAHCGHATASRVLETRHRRRRRECGECGHTFPTLELELDGPPLRLRELARLAGVGPFVVMAAVDEGKLTGSQVVRRAGSPWLFRRKDAARWLASRRDGRRGLGV